MGAAPELRAHRSLTRALQLIGSDRLRWLDEPAALGPVAALRMGPLTTWVISDANQRRGCNPLRRNAPVLPRRQ